MLLRMYTQNIDGLERSMFISPSLSCKVCIKMQCEI
jgi:NAD-dependent SIR2 family protein deacetylase